MKISKQVLSNIFEAAGDFDNANGYADSARKALEAGTLEIEGYERVQWTKFDQNDESTFPPCEGVYLVCRGVEPYFREAKFYGEKVGFGDTCVILWRPLPKIPSEIDGRYIREDRPECFSCDRKV